MSGKVQRSNCSDKAYIVASCKPWGEEVFQRTIAQYPGEWYFVGKKEQLTTEFIKEINPEYIFFLHWSWQVPDDIVESFESVCFHMTDVPYGRGGSPLQNLIIRGHRETKLSALQMVRDFDAGPVYMKENLSLDGNAEEIYIRASDLSAQMIYRIIKDRPVPSPQSGEVEVFKRRVPEQSEIPKVSSLLELYDFIRMLDAEGYPKAFINIPGLRLEFSRAALYNDRIRADVTIIPWEEQEK